MASHSDKAEALRRTKWIPDYEGLHRWREEQLLAFGANPKLLDYAHAYYAEHPVEFIEHWMDTFDPRSADRPGGMVSMPFLMFQRQRELIEFVYECIAQKNNGLVEKARDVGATWLCCGASVHLWRYRKGAQVGWGSRKEDLVDNIGDPKTIFEKMRMIIRKIPNIFHPPGFNPNKHMPFERIINPDSGAAIIGEAGDSIGRGGRTLVYFKDESAHYERPDAIEAALSQNTNTAIDISSVTGPGTLFHRKRQAAEIWTKGKVQTRRKIQLFVFDWRDHPLKDNAWYDAEERMHRDQGTLHILRQEVDRDYLSSQGNSIIKPEWVRASLDAHKKIRGLDIGQWTCALDVADSAPDDRLDKNAMLMRKGLTIMFAEQWGERDPGVTARRAIATMQDVLTRRDRGAFYYDSVGIGAAVKSEINRLTLDDVETARLLEHIKFAPWNAGAAVILPEAKVIPNDLKSPLNKDFFANMKAQAWWSLARRFHRTYQVLKEGKKHPTDMLISISSDTRYLTEIETELCQPVQTQDKRLRYLVDKKPKGAKSPNLGDCAMMLYFTPGKKFTYDSSLDWVA